MKYILKTLDENLKQSNDFNVLSDACAHYKKMKEYLVAMLTHNDLRLAPVCYDIIPSQNPEEDEELTPERLINDIQIAASYETQYYIIMRYYLENPNKTL